MAAAERWLPVPDWEDAFEVSSLGRVRSVRVLSLQRHPDGYPQVTLRRGGRTQLAAVHRLVMLAFAGPPPLDEDGKPMEVLHRNGKPGDPGRRNLRYGTKPENRADRERHRRGRTGKRKRKQGGTGELDGTGFLSDDPAVPVSRRAAS